MKFFMLLLASVVINNIILTRKLAKKKSPINWTLIFKNKFDTLKIVQPSEVPGNHFY